MRRPRKYLKVAAAPPPEIGHRFAADQGHALAQLNFGVLYGTGKAVKGNAFVENLIQPHFWFSLAAVSGNARGIKSGDIAVKMTTNEITELL